MSATKGSSTPLNTGTLAHLAELGKSGVTTLPVDVAIFDRSSLRRSIVHIGVGGFHRAHLAHYVDQLCRAGNTDWSIVGAGTLPGDKKMAEVLADQDCLYSLVVKGPEETSVSVIGSIVEYIHAHPDSSALRDQIAAPDTQLVSMTITEGGYPVDDATGAYDKDSPVAGPDSAFGIIASALELRRSQGLGPLTVVSCDNIVSNGAFAKAATLGEARQIDPALAEWIESEVAFPNSMVDRITPGTTDADRETLTEQTGMVDQWPVVTEPFTQWVLEDHFAGERPPVEDLGVILTDNVEPYERMKLQLLNAGHSCLAYLSALIGHEYVHGAMADDVIASYVKEFLAVEAAPVVPPVKDIDLVDYQASLIERFSNPAIADQVARLCLDGSVKFPKFLIPTVQAQVDAGGPVQLSALALAGWCRYLQGSADDGSAIEIAGDPNLEKAIAHAKAGATDPAAFLDFEEVFGSGLRQDNRFVAAFVEASNRLATEGAAASITALLNNTDGLLNSTDG